jgi:hypothetical protein
VVRIIVDDLEIGAQSHPHEQALEQVVAQERIFRDAILEGALECLHVVNALPDVAAFTEQILIHIGNRCGVRVESHVPRKHLGERRRCRTHCADRYTRLQDAVALGHPPRF